MLHIGGAPFTLSEAVQQLKGASANIVSEDEPYRWSKSHENYLLKIHGSGATKFQTLGALAKELNKYDAKEAELKKLPEGKARNAALTNHRGKAPTMNSAMSLATTDPNKLGQVDRDALEHLMTNGGVNKPAANVQLSVGSTKTHNTDPETGSAKGKDVSVKEFYLGGAEGRRATMRTEKGKTTYYYSSSHAANTYKYSRIG